MYRVAHLLDMNLKYSEYISDVNIDKSTKSREVPIIIIFIFNTWSFFNCYLQTMPLLSFTISFPLFILAYGENFRVIGPVISEILRGCNYPLFTREPISFTCNPRKVDVDP